MTREELMNCSAADILLCNSGSLVNLKQVEIDTALTAPDRMEQYLCRTGNPYLFRVDELTVKVAFTGKRDLTSVLSGLMS